MSVKVYLTRAPLLADSLPKDLYQRMPLSCLWLLTVPNCGPSGAIHEDYVCLREARPFQVDHNRVDSAAQSGIIDWQ